MRRSPEHRKTRRPALSGWVAALALWVHGCALAPHPEAPQPLDGLKQSIEIAAVPFYPQEEFQCGPAALAMALTWSGLAVTPQQLTPRVYTPGRQGSLQSDMIAAARRLGRIAYPISGEQELLGEILAGHPAIILQNLGTSWAEAWHYAVVIGADADTGELLLHSGLSARKRMPLALFRRTWSRGERWGLVILEPGRLPATAADGRYLECIVALERTGNFEAAAAGYRAGIERWPRNLTALMGLGNSRYALGDRAGAEKAFRAAVAAHSESGPAWNNLAHVLSSQGKSEEARAAARRAIALGGPLKETYERTLKEIESAGTPP